MGEDLISFLKLAYVFLLNKTLNNSTFVIKLVYVGTNSIQQTSIRMWVGFVAARNV